MPWSLGSEVHVDNLHAREDVHIDGDPIALSSLTANLSGAAHGLGIGAMHYDAATNAVTYSTTEQPTLTGIGDVPGLQTALNGKQASTTFVNALVASGVGSIAEDEDAGVVTYTPPVLNAAAVGLGNVTNTSDANKPVSSAQQTALNLKANLSNPTFTSVIRANDGYLAGNSAEVNMHKPFTGNMVELRCDKKVNPDHDLVNGVPGTGTDELRARLRLSHFMGQLGVYNETDSTLITHIQPFHDGKIYYQGTLDNSSDDRIKSYEENVVDATGTLGRLNPKRYRKHPSLVLDEADETPDLTGVHWTWEYGFIAQELESDAVLSHFVNTHPESGMKHVNYVEFVPILVQAIKELSARVTALGG